ncbi:NADH ubiquinone oxidoreductase subunit NDUFA12-domain-containing protein [Catenaria anguillulae PL171]|uniref:NADH dehydrogenase [ubiquinone] 1 alpha subcomplex subunit n=1 Tax=Catenaria anguillulae PL171 TaxID=765915 RepID=A0A1Y2HM52_9FUNG|nr:NADH ubiquinone oxidoreductase subunit NDUFA12-domain-containing protein [Catenaria anguillulae PL171]
MSFSLTRLITNVAKVGPKDAWHQLMILGEVKSGTLVGTDHHGNRYYENLNELWQRERWVVPVSKKFCPTDIPAEWHMWIHKVDSRTPQELADQLPKHKWIAPHTSSLTGSIANYKSYDTTPEPKVEAWTPKPASRS